MDDRCEVVRRSCFYASVNWINDLDVVILPPQGTCEVLRLLSSGDQPVQSQTVRLGQRFASLIPVALVGVDAANDDVIS